MSKKTNYENLVEEGNNQPSTIWKIFNEQGAGKQKSTSSNIRSVKLGDHEIEEPANAFNDFYINIAERIKGPSDPTNVEKIEDYCDETIPDDVAFDMPLLSSEYVLQSLKRLDVRKSTGTDDITETSPYSFGNIRKLSLYSCFMSIKLINSL